MNPPTGSISSSLTLPTKKRGALARARLDVTELNNMTPDMIASGAGIGPELN
jgi:hypothetical protein